VRQQLVGEMSKFITFRRQVSSGCSKEKLIKTGKVTKHGTIRYVKYGFLLVCYSNFVPKKCGFWDIRLQRMSWPWNPGQRSLKVIESGTIRQIGYGFLVFYCNFVPETRHFWDIWLRKTLWPWNPGQRSLKVIGTDTDRSATYDLLLTLHSNYRPILQRFRDRRRFHSKMANFPHPPPCI